ncbi:MAG: hypothetical protein A3J40_08555 [Erythrobacter sp. RIFCSPHIGHO2_12_FULL_63_10]|nr:MAG: hypothetical protein A3J40_08555 [Erythrobacter sp. RIFCSPHIGHO2_12_FULL_63_10]
MYANDGGEHHISGRFENRNESQDNGRADFVISSSDIDLPIIEFSGIAQAKYVAFGEYDESTGALVTGEIHTGQSGYVIFKVRAHRGSDQMTYVGFCKATLAFEAEAKN